MFASPGLVVAVYSRYAKTHPLLLQQEAAAAGTPAQTGKKGPRPPGSILPGGPPPAKVSGSTCDVFAPQSLIEQVTCPICLEVGCMRGLGFMM